MKEEGRLTDTEQADSIIFSHETHQALTTFAIPLAWLPTPSLGPFSGDAQCMQGIPEGGPRAVFRALSGSTKRAHRHSAGETFDGRRPRRQGGASLGGRGEDRRLGLGIAYCVEL